MNERKREVMNEYDFDEHGKRMMGGPMLGGDVDPVGLDPGIARTVAWVRSKGYITTDSGDGKTKFEKGWTEDDGVLLYPHVVISVRPDDLITETRRLRSLLEAEHGITIESMPPEPPDPPQIDSNYFVVSDTAMIVLNHVDDSMLSPTVD